jgi:hypothetical protein
MTGYDPFSFGQLRLGGKAGEAGAPPSGSPSGSPSGPSGGLDDLLFADAGPRKAPPVTTAADDDWAPAAEHSTATPMMQRPDSMAVEQFGSDILGEQTPVRAKPATAARNAGPVPRVAADGPNAAPLPRPNPLQPSPGNAAAAARAAAKAPARPSGIEVLPRYRRSGAFSILAPLALLVLGGSGAAWFWLLGQNPVMASILGCSTLVGSTLAYVSLRR